MKRRADKKQVETYVKGQNTIGRERVRDGKAEGIELGRAFHWKTVSKRQHHLLSFENCLFYLAKTPSFHFTSPNKRAQLFVS